MQRDALVDPVLHQPGQLVGMVGEEDQERVQVEGPRAELRFIARQRDLADLQLAARAPREHGRGAGRGEAVDRGKADPRGVGEIAFAELVDAAALARPAHDLVIDAQQIEGVETQQRDVRRLQDVAAGVEDDVGRALPRRGVEPAQPRQGLRRHLQPRQDAHAAAHPLEGLPPAGVERFIAGLGAGKAAGQLDHETRVDAVIAGRDAVAAAAAHRGPADCLLIARSAGDQIDDGGGGFARIRRGDPGGLDHRAGAKALAATGAGIGDRLSPRTKLVEIPGRNTAVAHHPLPIVTRPPLDDLNPNWDEAEALVQIANGNYHEAVSHLLAEATIMATNDPLCD